MSKPTEPELNAALWLIRRNLPDYPTTFGPCSRDCGRGPGRGGGPCLACATDDLAAMVGRTQAHDYVTALHNVRGMESTMREKIG